MNKQKLPVLQIKLLRYYEALPGNSLVRCLHFKFMFPMLLFCQYFTSVVRNWKNKNIIERRHMFLLQFHFMWCGHYLLEFALAEPIMLYCIVHVHVHKQYRNHLIGLLMRETRVMASHSCRAWLGQKLKLTSHHWNGCSLQTAMNRHYSFTSCHWHSSDNFTVH